MDDRRRSATLNRLKRLSPESRLTIGLIVSSTDQIKEDEPKIFDFATRREWRAARIQHAEKTNADAMKDALERLRLHDVAVSAKPKIGIILATGTARKLIEILAKETDYGVIDEIKLEQ